jgi:hypothetical protein
MSYPAPDNLQCAPAWENYVIAQSVAASRGQMPEHTLAFGVEVNGIYLRLCFQLSEVTEEDKADMSDIVSDLESLVGNDVKVDSCYEVCAHRHISPTDGVCWIFLARGCG